MKLPRYPKYKDGGVKWLGQVPEHWEVKALKYLATLNDDDLPENTDPDYEINYVDIGSVSLERGIEKTEVMPFGEAPSRARRRVKGGDVIISTVRTYLKAICPIDQPEENLIASTGFAVVRPRRDMSPRFAHYALQAQVFIDDVIARSTGVSYPAINPSELQRIKIPLPEPCEQELVSAFLEREIGKFDALVEQQKLLIELLKEKRQAIISHAVTKGLNPDALMKPSGVKWLGDVPTSWKVCLLKRAFRSIEYGISDAVGSDGSIAILRMGNIVSGKIDYTDLKYIDAVDRSLLLQEGDLLYNRTNSLDQIGKVGLFHGDVEGRFSFASYLVRLRTVSDSLPEFFAYLLNTENILGLARASAFVAIGQCNLNPSRYGRITVAIPPPKEQLEIVRYLDKATAKIDSLISDASSTIDILQERRAALITAAVTGQIDVRGESNVVR